MNVLFVIAFYYFVGHAGVEVPVESVDCCLNSRNFLCLFVGNVKTEVLFHGNNQLHRIQRVEAQLLKSGAFGQLGLVALGSRLQHLEDFSLGLLEKSDLRGIRGGGEGVPDLRHAHFDSAEGSEGVGSFSEVDCSDEGSGYSG